MRDDERRWDLRLKDVSLIQLPAADQEAALIKLDALPAATAIVVFLLAFAFLAIFVWPKIVKGLDDRNNKILGEIRAAEAAQAKAKAAQVEFEKRLEEARAEADRTVRAAPPDPERHAVDRRSTPAQALERTNN